MVDRFIKSIAVKCLPYIIICRDNHHINVQHLIIYAKIQLLYIPIKYVIPIIVLANRRDDDVIEKTSFKCTD